MAQALDPVTMAKMSLDNGQKLKGGGGRYFLSLCAILALVWGQKDLQGILKNSAGQVGDLSSWLAEFVLRNNSRPPHPPAMPPQWSTGGMALGPCPHMVHTHVPAPMSWSSHAQSLPSFTWYPLAVALSLSLHPVTTRFPYTHSLQDPVIHTTFTSPGAAPWLLPPPVLWHCLQWWPSSWTNPMATSQLSSCPTPGRLPLLLLGPFLASGMPHSWHLSCL